LKEENEYYNFKLKIAEEKEKVHERNLTSLQKLQEEYDEQKRGLHTDYKNKEEKLRKKFEQLEENAINKYREKENDLVDRIEKLSSENTNLIRSFEMLEKERDNLKETILKHEKIIRQKEDEYEQELLEKDKKLKELELYVRSVSEEANLQIAKLSNSVNEFNDKINYYKNREFDLSQEVVKLQKHAEQSEIIDLNKSRDIMHSVEVKMAKLKEENKHLTKTIGELNTKTAKQENDLNVFNNITPDIK
jgi:chromosome segregation ATPase